MAQGNELFGVAYQKNEWVFRQGDPGEVMYIIQSGAVEVRRSNDDDREDILAVLGKAEFFGEMALFDQRPRTASVVTLCPSRLLPLTRESLLNHIQLDPTVLLNLMQTISRRIESTNTLFRNLVAGDEELRFRLAEQKESPLEVAASHSELPFGLPATVHAPFLPDAFPGLSDNDGLNEFEAVRYVAGELIFRQGDPGDILYLIVDGQVEVEQKKEQAIYHVATLGPGDFFGEMALISGKPRMADARALSACRLLTIHRETFSRHLQTSPELGLKILQTLILRLRRNLSLAEVPAQSPDVLQNLLIPPLKKKGAIRLAVVSLSSCGGCAVSLLDDPEELARLQEKVSLTYCPMLIDEGSLPESDVILVEGAVRMEEDVEKLKEAREKGRFLVAWGTCASLGGIPALANQCELEALLDASYGRTQDTVGYYLSGGGTGTARLHPAGAKMLRRIDSLDARVRVDYFLPGCPPRTSLLLELIRELSGEPLTQKPKGVVCAECGRKAGKAAPAGTSSLQQPPALDRNTCLASQGFLCLGFVTKGGCGAPCTKGGGPCWGCRGPSETVAKKINAGSTLEELIGEQFKIRSRQEDGPVRDQIRGLRQGAFGALSFTAPLVWNPGKLR